MKPAAMCSTIFCGAFVRPWSCVVVAVARLALGVLVGLVGGWFRGTTERVVDVVGSIGVGLPALVLAIALISFRG